MAHSCHYRICLKLMATSPFGCMGFPQATVGCRQTSYFCTLAAWRAEEVLIGVAEAID